VAALVAAVAVAACTPTRGPAAGSPPAGPASGAAPSTGTSDQSGSVLPANPDPAKFAEQVRAHAHKAGINPQLLMAILYNENYKPHDPQLERAWQKVNPDAAFGIANMHKAAFDQAKHGRAFANRDWQDLPDDPDLAIQAAAWYLHDLAGQLPANPPAYTPDELIAFGYNAGPGNMKAIARGAKPGQLAQSYLDRLHSNWATADKAVQPH
jgi:hypothetical protein